LETRTVAVPRCTMVAGQIDLSTPDCPSGTGWRRGGKDPDEKAKILIDRVLPKSKKEREMRRKRKRTKGGALSPSKGIEQAHPFEGMNKVNPNAAGVDIGAEEIVVCVAVNESIQLVRGFGNYTVDLHAIAEWLSEHKIKTVAMESLVLSLSKQRGCTGSHCLKNWNGRVSNVC